LSGKQISSAQYKDIRDSWNERRWNMHKRFVIKFLPSLDMMQLTVND